ncbi:hypothetical protein AGMMS50229_00440 [Campylobacterota bacterium]|nr:hypothetical protein AGMMS50229_00440 [Campylobacterota bacterium]
MAHGVPVLLGDLFVSNGAGCLQIAHSGGEYQGEKIAYIDPKDIEVTLVKKIYDSKDIGVTLGTSLVDGISYCADRISQTSPWFNVQVVVKNPLFADEIMHRNITYSDYDVNSKINPTSDPTSYTSRAVANKVVGITGMPTLAEAQAEMDRMRPIFAEQERVAEEKAKTEREAKEKAKQAAEEAQAREDARVARQSEAYQVGYKQGRSVKGSSDLSMARMTCNYYAQNIAVMGRASFEKANSDCLRGINDARW